MADPFSLQFGYAAVALSRRSADAVPLLRPPAVCPLRLAYLQSMLKLSGITFAGRANREGMGYGHWLSNRIDLGYPVRLAGNETAQFSASMRVVRKKNGSC